MSIDVVSKVTIYEKDSEETHGIDLPTIEVKSHWNRREFIVLLIGGHSYTVVRADFEDAITNATRTGSR